MVTISIGLILGMMKVFKPLNEGAQKYMGDYIVCLMEYGELPTLGVSAQDLNKHATQGVGCDKKFKEFTFDEGRPPVSGGTSTTAGRNGSPGTTPNSTSTTSSTNGTDKDSNSKTNTTARTGDGDSNVSELSKGGSGSSSGASKSPYKNGQIQRKGGTYGTLDGGSADSGKSRVIDDGSGDDAAGGNGGRNRRQGRRGRNNTIYYGENYRAITGGKAFDALEKQLKKTQARKPTASVRSIAKEDGRFALSARREIVPQERIKAPQESSDDGKFTFGNFMRWLLIAGMVIAIVIFFGGQVMNYSNSSD